jgi:hypothetical protein
MRMAENPAVLWRVLSLIIAISNISIVSGNQYGAEAADARAILRAQGFKTDLSDFDFTISPEAATRVSWLTNSGLTNPYLNESAQQARRVFGRFHAHVMHFVGDDIAMVAWKQDRLPSAEDADIWPEICEALFAHRVGLDHACGAALSGPIAFNLDATAGHGLLLPHLASIRALSEIMATRALLDLNRGRCGSVWTNLLAATRLCTAWDPEPVEISQRVHFAMTATLLTFTWEVLQAHVLDEEQLAELEAEWCGVDFFHRLPEVAAFRRAEYLTDCVHERSQTPSGGISPAVIAQDPKNAWMQINRRRAELRYRDEGTYEDEKDLLLFFRDRELELKRAIKATSWAEMRKLPGVTNTPSFKSKYYSKWRTMLAIAEASKSIDIVLAAAAAQAEARRRIILTAIALERYYLAHHRYPASLDELESARADLQIDFMDGKPLRYRQTTDEDFVLYSTGLDCVDDGGKSISEFGLNRSRTVWALVKPGDIVWPRAGSPDEIAPHLLELQSQYEERQRFLEVARNRTGDSDPDDHHDEGN